MRQLKKFQEFLDFSFVRKQNPDRERARNLVLESNDKFNFFLKVKDKVGNEDLNPNYIVEVCYDVLIELVRARLLFEGYKTDSHEAEISYMRNIGFSENEVTFMNDLRYFRNGIKYYGNRFEKEYADKVLRFFESIHNKLLKLVENGK